MAGRNDRARPERADGYGWSVLDIGRLLVWLGGIALVVAGVFLVRYTIEIGLVTPELRMVAAALLGLLCIGAGEYARAGRWLSDDPRIAQALVGAGLAILYATAYGSHVLYGLIRTGTASAAMLAITAETLKSRRSLTSRMSAASPGEIEPTFWPILRASAPLTVAIWIAVTRSPVPIGRGRRRRSFGRITCAVGSPRMI